MNDLEKYFNNNDKGAIFKWNHYFKVYDRYFSKFRNKEVVILEIGVSQGGSLQMWKEYFGSKAKIYGIDIDPRCKQFEEENIEIFIGSQSDRKFLQEVKTKIPDIDILIDDGGHTMNQQIVSFEELYSKVKLGGIYLCEDVHTSYYLDYGGGHKRGGTFIEYSKKIIDDLNAYYSEQNSLKVNEITKTTTSIHFYPGMVIFEKGVNEKPYEQKSGNQIFTFKSETNKLTIKKIKKIMNNLTLIPINYMLRLFNIKALRGNYILSSNYFKERKKK